MGRREKVLGLMLALLMMFTACQPTPEAEPVIQKDTDKLIEMAVGTAAPESTDAPAEESVAPASTPEPVPFTQRFGERFTIDYTTTTSGAKVTGDVKIKYLSESTFPMCRVKNVFQGGEKTVELLKRLFGTEAVYIRESFKTKADLKADIDAMTEALQDEEWLQMHREEEEDYDQWLLSFQQRIQELQKQYNAMTGDEVQPLLKSWDGSNAEALFQDKTTIYFVGHEDDFGSRDDLPDASLFYRSGKMPCYVVNYQRTWNDSAFGYNLYEIVEDWDTPCRNAKITAQEAVDQAVALFDGILDVIPTEVRWGDNGSDDTRGSESGYVVYLSSNYEGAAAVYTKFLNNQEWGEDGAHIYKGWEHEKIVVAVNETGIRYMEWRQPMEVEKVITGNASLLDFDTIYSLFTQQMNRILADKDEDETVELMGVTLGLMAIAEKDSAETALLVPVWYFRYWDRNLSNGEKSMIGNQDMSPLCVLNAIDGSVISSVLDY